MEGNIVWDIDDSLIDFNESLRIWHNRHYGTNYEFEDIVEYHFDSLWGCAAEETTKRIREFYQSEEHGTISLFPGTKECVREFASLCPLVTATSRPKEVEGLTVALLKDRGLPDFTEHNFFGDIPGHTKALTFARMEKKPLFVVEDSLRQAMEYARADIPVLMLDRPWNRKGKGGRDFEKIIRVRGMPEIVDKGLRIIKTHRH